MIFEEWAEKYGLDSARRQFGISDHLVFVVFPYRWVRGVCGNWKCNQPLGNGEDVDEAKQIIRDALMGAFETEETIVEPMNVSRNKNGNNWACHIKSFQFELVDTIDEAREMAKKHGFDGIML